MATPDYVLQRTRPSRSAGHRRAVPFDPIDTSFARANVECARILLAAGADVSAKDADGHTVQSFASNNEALLPILLDTETEDKGRDGTAGPPKRDNEA